MEEIHCSGYKGPSLLSAPRKSDMLPHPQPCLLSSKMVDELEIVWRLGLPLNSVFLGKTVYQNKFRTFSTSIFL